MRANISLNAYLYILVLCVSVFGQAKPLALTLRGQEANLQSACGTCSKYEFLKTETKEFANGNTFVVFKEPVAQRDVVVFIPSQISADHFMELLIKVQTAKSNFARSVSGVVYPKGARITVVDKQGRPILNTDLIQQLIKTAGADHLNGQVLRTHPHILGTTKSDLPRPTARSRSTDRSAIVDTGTHSDLAKSIAAHLTLPMVSKQALSLKEFKRSFEHAVVVSSVAQPHNESFLIAIAQSYELVKSGVRVSLVTPYLPYARSDKVDQSGVAVIGRLAADMIEASGVSAVQFVRSHAPQSEGFFRIPTIQTMGRTTINGHLRSMNVEQVISPDAGFQKDATLYADDLKVPVAVINKQRDPISGEAKIVDMSGSGVNGKIVAIIDDETASGKTLHLAAEFLKSKGASKVIAVVTHLAGDAAQAVNSPYIDQMVVTDTFAVKVVSPKLKVLSIANEMSRDLKRMLNPAMSCRAAYN